MKLASEPATEETLLAVASDLAKAKDDVEGINSTLQQMAETLTILQGIVYVCCWSLVLCVTMHLGLSLYDRIVRRTSGITSR